MTVPLLTIVTNLLQSISVLSEPVAAGTNMPDAWLDGAQLPAQLLSVLPVLVVDAALQASVYACLAAIVANPRLSVTVVAPAIVTSVAAAVLPTAAAALANCRAVRLACLHLLEALAHRVQAAPLVFAETFALFVDATPVLSALVDCLIVNMPLDSSTASRPTSASTAALDDCGLAALDGF